jgi:hypothetical protein
MLTGARRRRVARTMPVTVDHGQQLRVGVRAAAAVEQGVVARESGSSCGAIEMRPMAVIGVQEPHQTHLGGFCTRGEPTGRDAPWRSWRSHHHRTPAAGRRLSRSRIAAALRRAGRRRDLEPATEPIEAVRDPGRGPPPVRPDSREACLWRVSVRSRSLGLVRCCPVKQEPAGHAAAWRKHWSPGQGRLPGGAAAPAITPSP